MQLVEQGGRIYHPVAGCSARPANRRIPSRGCTRILFRAGRVRREVSSVVDSPVEAVPRGVAVLVRPLRIQGTLLENPRLKGERGDRRLEEPVWRAGCRFDELLQAVGDVHGEDGDDGEYEESNYDLQEEIGSAEGPAERVELSRGHQVVLARVLVAVGVVFVHGAKGFGLFVVELVDGGVSPVVLGRGTTVLRAKKGHCG